MKTREDGMDKGMLVLLIIVIILASIVWQFRPDYEDCIVTTLGEPHFNETLNGYVQILTLNNTCDKHLKVIVKLT